MNGLLFAGLLFTALGAYGCYYYPKMRKALTGRIEGTVVRYREGTAHINRKKIAKVWYPTVAYTVNGVTHSYDCTDCYETEEPLSTEGKTVSLLYNPANPKICRRAENIQAKGALAVAAVVMLVGIGLIVLSFVA